MCFWINYNAHVTATQKKKTQYAFADSQSGINISLCLAGHYTFADLQTDIKITNIFRDIIEIYREIIMNKITLNNHEELKQLNNHQRTFGF